MRTTIAFLAVLFLGIVLGFLLFAGGCRRPAGSGNAAGGADNPAQSSSDSQGDSPNDEPATNAGRNSGTPDAGETSANHPSQPGVGETTGSPTGNRGSRSGGGNAGGGGIGGGAPGSRDSNGASGAAGSGGTGKSSGQSGQAMPGRDAAVRQAREALARSGKGNSRESYRELLQAWQDLQRFVEHDRDSASLASQLLRQMERLGSELDRTPAPDIDKPLIAE